MVYSILISILLSCALSDSSESDIDDNSCAYFSTHVVAEPLSTCAAYSYHDVQYSWTYSCDDSEHVNMNYFALDTECTEASKSDPIGIDDVGGFVQCKGKGENCHTVDIKVKGFTDTTTSECNDDTDYFKFSFVIDECIPSILEGAEYSAVLSCDSEKLFFEYYSGCTNCACDMETFTYEYYNDFDGCWDILCGHHEQYGVGTPNTITTTQPPKEPKCKNLNSKYHADKLKALLMKPMDLTKAKYYSSKTKAFAANVIDGNDIHKSTQYIYNKVLMNWIYIVAVGCAVILLGGAYKFIKQKEYSMI